MVAVATKLIPIAGFDSIVGESFQPRKASISIHGGGGY
jgi:hypothetical protein